MTNLFGFLLLGALLALLVGLVKPAAVVFWRKPATRVHVLAYAALVVVAFFGIGVTALPPTPAEQAKSTEAALGAVAPALVAEPKDSAAEAVSPSSAFSRTLRGVFIQPVTCTPNRIRLGDSVEVKIKEAWLEKLWEPKSGGLFGDPNYSKGYAIDSTTQYPRTQLVLAFAPDSKLGHFEQSGWKLALATDTYREHTFSRSRGNQLVLYFLRSNAVFPIKLYVRARRPANSLPEQSVVLDSLTLR